MPTGRRTPQIDFTQGCLRFGDRFGSLLAAALLAGRERFSTFEADGVCCCVFGWSGADARHVIRDLDGRGYNVVFRARSKGPDDSTPLIPVLGLVGITVLERGPQ